MKCDCCALIRVFLSSIAQSLVGYNSYGKFALFEFGLSEGTESKRHAPVQVYVVHHSLTVSRRPGPAIERRNEMDRRENNPRQLQPLCLHLTDGLIPVCHHMLGCKHIHIDIRRGRAELELGPCPHVHGYLGKRSFSCASPFRPHANCDLGH